MPVANGAGEVLQVEQYTHLRRWADEVGARPAVQRGRRVNRTFGDPADQCPERHEAADLVEDLGVIEVIVGLPRHLDGRTGASARDARRWARALADRVRPVTVRLVDERLTTVTAHRSLHEAGCHERGFRAVVDQAAAVVILEQALETERRTGAPAGELLRPTIRGGKA